MGVSLADALDAMGAAPAASAVGAGDQTGVGQGDVAQAAVAAAGGDHSASHLFAGTSSWSMAHCMPLRSASFSAWL